MLHLKPKERKAAEWVRDNTTHLCSTTMAYMLLVKFSILFGLNLDEVVKTVALKKDQEDEIMGEFK